MRARMALRAVAWCASCAKWCCAANRPRCWPFHPKARCQFWTCTTAECWSKAWTSCCGRLRRHDPEHWLPDTEAQHADHLALIAQCDGPFKAHLDRYKYPNRYDLPDGLEHRAQGSLFLGRLDSTLTRTAYLAGAAWGLPDAAVAPFVRQWAHTDPDWFASQPWTALQKWLQTFEDSPRSRASWLGLHLGRPETRPSCGPTPSTYSPSPSEGRPYNRSFTTLLRRLWIPAPAWSWRPS